MLTARTSVIGHSKVHGSVFVKSGEVVPEWLVEQLREQRPAVLVEVPAVAVLPKAEIDTDPKPETKPGKAKN
jgi:hypothetical protein